MKPRGGEFIVYDSEWSHLENEVAFSRELIPTAPVGFPQNCSLPFLGLYTALRQRITGACMNKKAIHQL